MSMMGNSNENPFNQQSSKGKEEIPSSSKPKVKINQEELKAKLTPIQYAVTQEKATERYGFGNKIRMVGLT